MEFKIKNKTKLNTTQQFFTCFLILVLKSWHFQSCDNMTMHAAILCPAVCVRDITNKASMYGKSIVHITSL